MGRVHLSQLMLCDQSFVRKKLQMYQRKDETHILDCCDTDFFVWSIDSGLMRIV